MGGTHLGKGYGDVRPLGPLFTLSQQFAKSMFRFLKALFSTKITNLTNFAVLEPKFTQNFRSKAFYLKI